MTEDEAKTKWCPFARAVKAEPNGGGVKIEIAAPVHNRFTTEPGAAIIPAGATCMGSLCAAWRWDPNQAVGEYNSDYDRIKKPHMRRGWCGLAGSL